MVYIVYIWIIPLHLQKWRKDHRNPKSLGRFLLPRSQGVKTSMEVIWWIGHGSECGLWPPKVGCLATKRWTKRSHWSNVDFLGALGALWRDFIKSHDQRICACQKLSVKDKPSSNPPFQRNLMDALRLSWLDVNVQRKILEMFQSYEWIWDDMSMRQSEGLVPNCFCVKMQHGPEKQSMATCFIWAQAACVWCQRWLGNLGRSTLQCTQRLNDQLSHFILNKCQFFSEAKCLPVKTYIDIPNPIQPLPLLPDLLQQAQLHKGCHWNQNEKWMILMSQLRCESGDQNHVNHVNHVNLNWLEGWHPFHPRVSMQCTSFSHFFRKSLMTPSTCRLKQSAIFSCRADLVKWIKILTVDEYTS